MPAGGLRHADRWPAWQKPSDVPVQAVCDQDRPLMLDQHSDLTCRTIGPYVMGLVRDAAGSFPLGLLTIAMGSVIGGLVVLLLGRDRRLEQAASVAAQ